MSTIISLTQNQINNLILVEETQRRAESEDNREYYDNLIWCLSALVEGEGDVQVFIEDVLTMLGARVEASDGLGTITVELRQKN